MPEDRSKRFIWKPGDLKVSQCIHCRRFRNNRKCTAYDEIPLPILTNEHNHREPYPGDGGKLFVPKED